MAMNMYSFFFFFSTFLLILLFCSSTINPLTFMLYSSIDSICQRNSMRSCRYIIFILFEIYFNDAATPMKSPSVIIFICVLIVPRIGVCIHEYSTANENKDSCYMRTSSLERNWPTKASPVWFAWFYMDWRCCCGGDGKMATMPNSSMTILWKRSGEDENEKKDVMKRAKKKKNWTDYWEDENRIAYRIGDGWRVASFYSCYAIANLVGRLAVREVPINTDAVITLSRMNHWTNLYYIIDGHVVRDDVMLFLLLGTHTHTDLNSFLVSYDRHFYGVYRVACASNNNNVWKVLSYDPDIAGLT